MKLKEYIDALNIDPVYFAYKAGIARSSMYAYLAGDSTPTQKIAESIEELTLGVVTVTEMRGKDDRFKPCKLKKANLKPSI